MKKIDTRNLVVAETFDEFFSKVEDIDITVEDVVGYITSLAYVIYNNSLENSWGILGFVWDHLEDITDEEVLSHPNPLYRTTQTTAEGENIEMDQQWLIDNKVKKGYGHFVLTTIPFNIIPNIPDGYRITELRNTFTSIKSNDITVLKSDWTNLIKINGLVRDGQSINIDLTGANIGNSYQTIVSNVKKGIGYLWGSKVYIKGDLSNCTSGVFEGHNDDSTQSWTSRHTLILDDENKSLQIPKSLLTSTQLYYTNPDKIFDYREWFSDSETIAKNKLVLLSASNKYLINWKERENYTAAGGWIRISPLCGTNINPYNFTGYVTKTTNPVAQNIIPADITIDVRGSSGNVNEDGLYYYSDYYFRDNNDFVRYYDTTVYNPIKYIGEVTNIRCWNPFCLVKDDDSWPEYDQSMIDKLTPYNTTTTAISGTNSYGINQGYFMNHAYIYLSKPSPYTIDCKNLTCINVLGSAHFYVKSWDNFTSYSNNVKAIKLFDLKNTDNLISCSLSRSDARGFYLICPSFKTIFWQFMGTLGPSQTNDRLLVPKDAKIEASWFPYSHYVHNIIEDSTITTLKVRHIDCRNYGAAYSMQFYMTYWNFITGGKVYNYMEFEDGLLEDIEFLKAANFTNFNPGNGGGTFNYPIVVVRRELSITIYSPVINSDFIFIYRSNINITNFYRRNISGILPLFINKILPGIQPNDTTSGYSILLSKNIYDSLTQEQKNYIINDLNYNLQWTTD